MTEHFTQLGLREQIDAVTSGQVEARSLAAATIDRVRRSNPRLNAACALFDAEARMEPVPGGRLAGVPVAVKDTFALPWYAPRDATPVAYRRPGAGASGVFRRLHDAGCTVAFATNMHQLGFGTTGHVSAYGPCRNPWDLTRCPGGSSSGSAAAVAARLVPLAIGTDAVGSVRIPASYCGVTGLKPTWGAVPSDGCAGASSMMAIGPITRDAADCRLASEVLLSKPLPPGDRRACIGLPVEAYWSDVDPAVLAACRRVIELLGEAGCEIVEITLPRSTDLARTATTVLGAERLARMTPHWRKTVLPTLHPTIQRSLEASMAVPEHEVGRARAARQAARDALEATFEHVDLVAWPTVPTSPPALERPRAALPSGTVSADLAAMRTTGLANLTGVPAITVPCGLDGDGLPVGLMFHAPWHGEGLLLDTAELVERVTERRWVGREPNAEPTHATARRVSR
ncbi:amidase [Prauserella muralis]|uniref:Uncharacterized protein n=1 Tax=Prauserella muralis TaxID=588067 RepID=A0A2V4AGB5_9PSEU|nr:amidase [Prauserella muralis]PXY18889.1 hypothetical protein BAY60_29045 [Prauserella muralis]TWE28757.1 amidase/aspartyl-tRNA(Asn)/glutamyl-tRNA(Gln) amidotransferase subunit A [Prauserella muralis]